MTLGLYLHVPFCVTKCNYCDFNTYAGIEDLIPAYVDALVLEIGMWGRVVDGGPQVDTIFFGGGTPSHLPVEQIRRIVEACNNAFDVGLRAEVTLESNPGDLTSSLLEGLLSAGVNRLSIGVQSFHNRHLAALTRRHSAAEAVKAFRRAKDAGFASVNLDLMYGLPEQSLQEWEETLAQAMELRPEHLSLYALTLEEGTPLHRNVRQGTVADPDPDLAADMYLLTEERLDRAGYRHYEISSWALPGQECRHNLVYWRNLPYLGMGAGAHSGYEGYRFSDERSPRRYVERVSRLAQARKESIHTDVSEEMLRMVAPIDQLEVIDLELEMAETMMLGLRLEEGVSYAGFEERFERSLESVYGTEIRELEGLELLERRPSTLGHVPHDSGVDGSEKAKDGGTESVRLTPRGRLLGNEVFSRFVEVRV